MKWGVILTIYAFWNNKGGTGKTSLAFQSICSFADLNKSARILAIDLCPQANLSELFLGGLVGQGNTNLAQLHAMNPRKSVGGYFEKRLPAPFSVPALNYQDFISNPASFNNSIPPNIDLLAGDQIVELQSNAITTLSNTQIPGTDTWIRVIDWIRDFIALTGETYTHVFIDSNPSFAVYTQIALSTAERLILPVMADDSSRRAIQNMFALIHGINVPSGSTYSPYSFPTKISSAGRTLPKIHLIAKNRLTQYMGPASAYSSVLASIDQDVSSILATNPSIFTFTRSADGFVNVKDFQTTGVVAFAEGTPFNKVSTGRHYIMGREISIKWEYLDSCISAINTLVAKL